MFGQGLVHRKTCHHGHGRLPGIWSTCWLPAAIALDAHVLERKYRSGQVTPVVLLKQLLPHSEYTRNSKYVTLAGHAMKTTCFAQS